MSTPTYTAAMDEALGRLTHIGFEQGGHFASHATMAAEALAALGYTDAVADWVEWSKASRRYTPEPTPNGRIDVGDESSWRSALGKYRRAADWVATFEAEIAEHGWHDVLITWWPRLLPGLSGGLTHGLIRTAHAVRGVSATPEPTPLQIREFAHGLGYWAAVYTPVGSGLFGRRRPAGAADIRSDVVESALSDLTARHCGIYASSNMSHPVPLVHTITAPSAVRLVLEHLPTEQHAPSYLAVLQVSQALLNRFTTGTMGCPDGTPTENEIPHLTPDLLAAEAAELRDEHAIKLAEAARREYALRRDIRYLSASWALMERLKRF
jgi:hypothetical protein